MKKVFLFSVSLLLFYNLSTNGQSNFSEQTVINKFHRTKTIRIGYGPILAGDGDLWGQRLILGTQFFISKHSAFDLRLAGSLIDKSIDANNNPDWNIHQVSNGIDFVLEYNYILQYKNFRLYPSAGPAIRYSYERHCYSYGVMFNQDTQTYDWFCDVWENTGWRLGYVAALNADFTLFKKITIGPRFSFSHFPKDGLTYAFFGITVINQNF